MEIKIQAKIFEVTVDTQEKMNLCFELQRKFKNQQNFTKTENP